MDLICRLTVMTSKKSSVGVDLRSEIAAMFCDDNTSDIVLVCDKKKFLVNTQKLVLFNLK
jgi:hypothetical protein